MDEFQLLRSVLWLVDSYAVEWRLALQQNGSSTINSS